MSGSWEIERRFLVEAAPGLRARLEARAAEGSVEAWPLRQGYVRSRRPSLRIRTGEPRGNVFSVKTGGGLRRREVETLVPDEMAELLFEAAGDRILSKVRFVIPPGWELDFFDGDLEGLVFLEMELPDEDEPLPELPDGLRVLHEVTDTKGFTSNRLASLYPKARRALVRRLLEDPGGDPARHWKKARAKGSHR